MSLKSRRKQEERKSNKQRYHPLEIQKQTIKNRPCLLSEYKFYQKVSLLNHQ